MLSSVSLNLRKRVHEYVHLHVCVVSVHVVWVYVCECVVCTCVCVWCGFMYVYVSACVCLCVFVGPCVYVMWGGSMHACVVGPCACLPRYSVHACGMWHVWYGGDGKGQSIYPQCTCVKCIGRRDSQLRTQGSSPAPDQGSSSFLAGPVLVPSVAATPPALEGSGSFQMVSVST